MKLAGLFLSFAFANTSELFISTKQVGEYMDTIAKMADEGERPERPCIREFLEGCFYCAENIQQGSPFCDESNPNFNGVMCAIQLNKCLIEQLDGILQCPK